LIKVKEKRRRKKARKRNAGCLGEKEGYEMFFVGVASPSQLSKAPLG
jgi:hypothetical protein